MPWQYRTQFDYDNTSCCCSCCGSRLQPNFILSVDEKGCQYLKHTSDSDRYALIQSYRDSVDLPTILKGLDPKQVNGMMSTYKFSDLVDAGIIDFTSLPKTPGEMLNLAKSAESYFNGLPDEIRKEFNYSSDLFVRDYGSKHYQEKIHSLRMRYDDDYRVAFNTAHAPKPVESLDSVEPVEPVESLDPVEPVQPVKSARGRKAVNK